MPAKVPSIGRGSREQPALEEQGCVRHLQFTEPLRVIMNSRNSQGVIYKPRSR